MNNRIQTTGKILAIILFLLSEPFFVWSIFSSNFIYLSTLFVLSVLFWSNRKFDARRTAGMFLLWTFSLVLLWFGRGLNVFGLFQFILMFSIPFASLTLIKSTITFFRSLMAYLLAFSCFFYILHMIGVPLPNTVISSLNPLKDYNMVVYPFFTLEDIYTPIIRFPAYWDEPGALGTYAVLLLGLNNFTLKGWKDFVIILSGLLSLSLFFYVCFLLILVVKMIQASSFYVYIFIPLIAFVLIYYVFKEDTILYQIIGARLQIDDQTGTIAGNNRMTEYGDYYYNQLRWYDMSFLFGSRFNPNNAKVIGGSFSYKTAILLYGFIPCLFYVFSVILQARRCIRNNIRLLIFLFFFSLIMYQRPDVSNPVYVFLLFSWIIKFSEFYNYEKKTFSIS